MSAKSELPEPLTNALRTFLWPGALDTTRGEHLAWLVKVPGFVTKAWRATAAALERADELFGDEDDEHELHTTRADGKETVETTEKNDKELLGHMRIAVDPFAPPEKRQRHFLTLAAARAAEHGIPARYDMQTTSEDRPMHVFSAVRENTAAAAAAAARDRAARGGFESAAAAAAVLPVFVLEGVSERSRRRPASLTDAAYRQVSLRMEEATKRRAWSGTSRVCSAWCPCPRRGTCEAPGRHDGGARKPRADDSRRTRWRTRRWVCSSGATCGRSSSWWRRRSSPRCGSRRCLRARRAQPARAQHGHVDAQGHVQEEGRGGRQVSSRRLFGIMTSFLCRQTTTTMM